MPGDPVVHVIDDDDAVRHSLEFLITTADLPVRSYGSAREFLATLPTIRAGCIVTDVRMPEMTGIDLLRQVGEVQPALPVIVITGHADVPLAVEAMRLGAVDFLEKPFDDEVLLASVRAALEGSETDAAREAERRTAIERINTLSRREREVLDGLVAGHPNKTIAFDLAISPRTVEIYRSNLMSKMQADSLSDLVRMAIVADLVPLRTPR